MPEKYLNETTQVTTLDADDIIAVATESGADPDLKHIRLGDFPFPEQAPPVSYSTRVSGLLSGGGLTLSTPTTIEVVSGVGLIVDNYTDPENPVTTRVSWPTASGLTPPGMATNIIFYVFVNVTGAVEIKPDPVDESDFRTKIFLGTVITTTTEITAVTFRPFRTNFGSYALVDLALARGFARVASGVKLSPIAGEIRVAISQGAVYSIGVNPAEVSRPNHLQVSAQSPITFTTVTSSGSNVQSGSDFAIDIYDVAGTPTAVPNPGNNCTISRVFYTAQGAFVQVGPAYYPSLENALFALASDSALFSPYPPLERFGALIGYVIARKDATDFSDPAQARVLSAARVGV